MVILMKFLPDPAQRARRLLKLYPQAWRERYGDEFVDFMEQSITDDPHNAMRMANIIYKGVKVRLGDLGVVGPTFDDSRTPKVALGTATFLASIFAVFALFYWACAMVSWNSDPRVATSVAESIWMGAITVSTILLCLTLLTIGLTLIVRAGRMAVRERDRRLFILLTLILVSVATIINSTYQYTRWTIARGGIQWTGAGAILKQIAGNTQWVTQSTIWGPSWTGWHFWSNDGPLHYGTPLAVFVLAISVAKLARRVDYSDNANRAARFATKLLSFAMVTFLLGFAGWTLAGGFTESWEAPFTQMETSLFLVIIFIAVVTFVTAFKNRTSRNAIKVISGTAVGLVGLLVFSGVAWQSLSAPSPSGRQDAYVVIGAFNGQVLALGPATTVVLNPKTGQIVSVSTSKSRHGR
jgi:hypothetical protein